MNEGIEEKEERASERALRLSKDAKDCYWSAQDESFNAWYDKWGWLFKYDVTMKNSLLFGKHE